MNIYQRAAVGLAALAWLGAIVALWWWALAGMSETQGAAASATVVLFGFSVPMLWMFGKDRASDD